MTSEEAAVAVRSGLLAVDLSWSVRQLVQEMLQEKIPEISFRQLLLAVFSRWYERYSRDPGIGVLPALVFQANGGDPLQATPLVAAWQLVHLSAKLIDDVQDGEASGQPAETVNLAAGLLFAAHLALEKLAEADLFDNCAAPLTWALNGAMLRACAGQHADDESALAPIDPDTWLEVARAKSGALLAWAAWAGALIADVDAGTLDSFHTYGSHLGVLLQIADDFNGVWGAAGGHDLATRQLSLPVCYALWVLDREARAHLEALLQRAGRGDRAAEARARQRLIGLGAQSYLLVVARLQYRCAVAALQHTRGDESARQPLFDLLDRIIPALKLIVDCSRSI